MVTLVEAQAQISEAEKATAIQEAEIQQARAGFIKETEPKAQTLLRQAEAAKVFGKGEVSRFFAEEKKAKLVARQKGLPQFARAEEQITEFRGEITTAKEKLAEAKKEVERVRKANIAISQRNRDIEMANRALRGSIPTAILTKSQKRLVREAREGTVLQQKAQLVASAQSRDVIRKFEGGEITQFQALQTGLVTFEQEPISKFEQLLLEPSALEKITGKAFISETPKVDEPLLTVEAVEKPEDFLGELQFDISGRRAELETKGARDKITITERAEFFGLGVGLSIASLPSRVIGFGKGLATEPVKTVTAIPSEFKRFGAEIGVGLASKTPEFALGTLGGEILILKGTGKAISGAGRVTEFATTRLSPKFAPIGKVRGGTGIGIIGTEKIFERSGATIKGLLGEDISLFKREVSGFGDIPFAPSPISKVAESVPFQLERVGKTRTVVSAQTGFKFGGELDRLLFFDPKGRLRISRIGKAGQQEASLLDILSGDITFRKGKAQALIGEFEIEAPPTDILQSLRAEKPLTPTQLERFGEFIESPSGKIKPVPQFIERGFGAIEPEVAFGKGEIPFKIKTPAVTLIEGKKVRVIEFGVKTASKETQKALSDIGKTDFKISVKDIGGISQKQLQTSLKTISKETGFSIQELSSQFFPSKPFVSLPKVSLSGFSLASLFKTSKGLEFPSKTDFSIPSPKSFISPRPVPSKVSPPPQLSPASPISPPPIPRVPIGAFSFTAPSFAFEGFGEPPPRRTSERKRKVKKKVVKRKKIKTPVRPSFTAIITGFRPRPFISKKIGVAPFSIRGLETGRPKKKKGKKKNPFSIFG